MAGEGEDRRGAGAGRSLQVDAAVRGDRFHRDTNVRFSAELRRLQSLPKCERLPLPSFLLLPFQRITRLRMLLQVPVPPGGRGGGGPSREHSPPPPPQQGGALLPGFSTQDPPSLAGADQPSLGAVWVPRRSPWLDARVRHLARPLAGPVVLGRSPPVPGSGGNVRSGL